MRRVQPAAHAGGVDQHEAATQQLPGHADLDLGRPADAARSVPARRSAAPRVVSPVTVAGSTRTAPASAERVSAPNAGAYRTSVGTAVATSASVAHTRALSSGVDQRALALVELADDEHRALGPVEAIALGGQPLHQVVAAPAPRLLERGVQDAADGLLAGDGRHRLGCRRSADTEVVQPGRVVRTAGADVVEAAAEAVAPRRPLPPRPLLPRPLLPRPWPLSADGVSRAPGTEPDSAPAPAGSNGSDRGVDSGSVGSNEPWYSRPSLKPSPSESRLYGSVAEHLLQVVGEAVVVGVQRGRRAVQQAVVVAVGRGGVRAGGELDGVADAVAVGVGAQRVRVQAQLVAVGHAVAVGVRAGRVGAEHQLAPVGEAVAVGVDGRPGLVGSVGGGRQRQVGQRGPVTRPGELRDRGRVVELDRVGLEDAHAVLGAARLDRAPVAEADRDVRLGAAGPRRSAVRRSRTAAPRGS